MTAEQLVANGGVPIVEATPAYMDAHVASCVFARCWLCSTYQRVWPAEWEAAIARGRRAHGA